MKLSKLTIKNGSAHKGGGIYIDLGSNVTAEDCMIQLNHAIHSGGGVYVEVTSAFKLDGTKIFLNTAGFGGGIYTDGKVDLGYRRNLSQLSISNTQAVESTPIRMAQSHVTSPVWSTKIRLMM